MGLLQFLIPRRSFIKGTVALAKGVTSGTHLVDTKSIQSSVNQFLARGLDPQIAETLSSLVIRLNPIQVNPDPGTRLKQELDYRRVAEELATPSNLEHRLMLGEQGKTFEGRFAYYANFFVKPLKDSGTLPNDLSILKSEFWPRAFREFHYSAHRIKEHNQERKAIIRDSLELILDLQKSIVESKGTLNVKKLIEVLTADQDLLNLIGSVNPHCRSMEMSEIKAMRGRLKKIKPDADLMEFLQAMSKMDAPLVKTLETLLRQSSLLSRDRLLEMLGPLLEQNEIAAISTTVENCMPQILQTYQDFRTLDHGGEIRFKDELPEFASYRNRSRRLYPSHLSFGDRSIGNSLNQKRGLHSIK